MRLMLNKICGAVDDQSWQVVNGVSAEEVGFKETR